jgi:hypothetical protein
MREPPYYAYFIDIDKTKIAKESYQLHIFITKKGEELSDDLSMRVKDWFNHKSYGGWTGIFGGRGNTCKTCKDSPIFSVKIDITSKMHELNLTSEEVELHLKIVAK